MTFLRPIGLLGLLAIPVIIIIYILKSKYTEQTASSTYLWRLSDKFLKKRKLFSGLTGIITLLLEIATVTALSLIIARPIITLPHAARDYCFILDTSSSMLSLSDGKTRLDIAKDGIKSVIDLSRDGSSYTLVTVSGSTAIAYSDVTDKKEAISLLEKTEADTASSLTDDIKNAADAALERLSSYEIYVYTDRSYGKADGINLVTVPSVGYKNVSVGDASYSHTGSLLSVSFDLVLSGGNDDVTVYLNVDGKTASEHTASLTDGAPERITLEYETDSFGKIEILYTGEDSYSLDNSITLYNLTLDKSYSILIVSERPFFLKAAIDSLIDSEITVIDPDEYASVSEKFGLYVFDSYEPAELPDGAVWLINTDTSIENSGFGVRGRADLSSPDTLEASTSTSTETRRLLEGISGDDIYVSGYVKYSEMYLKFSTLYTHSGSPVIFVGQNGLGERQAVIGFDLHSSDLPLSSDYVTLIRNLLKYSFPDVIDSTLFTVGDEVNISILPDASGYRAKSPSDKDIYIDMSTPVSKILLDEVGTYTLTVTKDGRETNYKIYSAAHPTESAIHEKEDSFTLTAQSTDGTRDGKYDPITLLFIILAIVFIADWGVFCYEKYQLR